MSVSILEACPGCVVGLHDECHTLGILEDQEECCCGGQATLREALYAIHQADNALAELYGLGPGTEVTGLQDDPGERPQPKKGDSGYIHPDAWGSTKNIGELVDPESTGRKRQAKMFPIAVGQVCEWAGKANAGGEFMPVGIIGCVNNPATDLHHGPDKNTLNNEKVSRGIGTTENTHIICSECHNATHAANDAFYPEYDRVLDQATPWLPIYPDGWAPTAAREASTDELFAEEARRAADRKRRGRKTRGRNSRARGDVDTSIDGDD
jgi:hypothetical protein